MPARRTSQDRLRGTRCRCGCATSMSICSGVNVVQTCRRVPSASAIVRERQARPRPVDREQVALGGALGNTPSSVRNIPAYAARAPRATKSRTAASGSIRGSRSGRPSRPSRAPAPRRRPTCPSAGRPACDRSGRIRRRRRRSDRRTAEGARRRTGRERPASSSRNPRACRRAVRVGDQLDCSSLRGIGRTRARARSPPAAARGIVVAVGGLGSAPERIEQPIRREPREQQKAYRRQHEAGLVVP